MGHGKHANPAKRSSRAGRSLAHDVAEALERELTTFTGRSLPPLAELGKRFHASRPVVSRAVHLLAERGLLFVRPGRRVSVMPNAKPPLESTLSSSERLYRELREDITSGKLRAGRALPKVDYYVLRAHVSNRTVLKVYRRLVAEGMARHCGKDYLVGAERAFSSVFSVSRPYTIAMITPQASEWEAVCESKRTQEFALTFIGEAERHGVRLVLVPPVTPVPRSEAELLCEQRLRDTLTTIGDRLLGILIAGRHGDPAAVVDNVFACGGSGKPVVWFDSTGRSCDGDIPRGVTRCHYSEAAAVEAAIEHLAALGHRKVAYLPTAESGWQMLRREALVRAAQRPAVPVELLVHQKRQDSDWEKPGQTGIIEYISRLHATGPTIVRESLDWFVEQRAVLLERFAPWRREEAKASPYAGVIAASGARQNTSRGWEREEAFMHLGRVWAGLALWPVVSAGVTAIIAPNDALARGNHLSWMRELELRVPSDISIVAFDNSYRTSFFPLSSVDMGFGYLGYQAFHAILGDVPVKRDRRGNIPARACVVDRGSSAAARSGE